MNFLLTGTRVYGPASEDSDLDVVVDMKDAIGIGKFLAEHSIQLYNTPGQDSYGDKGGFYFDFAGVQVNVIIAQTTDEFKAWEKRTERMKTIPPIPDRETRVATFNQEEEDLGVQLCYLTKGGD